MRNLPENLQTAADINHAVQFVKKTGDRPAAAELSRFLTALLEKRTISVLKPEFSGAESETLDASCYTKEEDPVQQIHAFLPLTATTIEQIVSDLKGV